MKKTILIVTSLMVSGVWLLAAEGEPKAALESATKALTAKPNYSWTTTVEWRGQEAGKIEGKTEKGGPTVMTLSRGDNSVEAVCKDGKWVVHTDDGWKTAAEATAEEAPDGPGKMVGRILQRFQIPGAEAADLLNHMKAIKLAEGIYTGELTDEEAKSLMLLGRRGGSGGPEIKEAKGSARFWTKEGALVKYEYSLEGKISINGEERDASRKHTIEIKGVGETKVTVPAEAAKKV